MCCGRETAVAAMALRRFDALVREDGMGGWERDCYLDSIVDAV
jgi:hypothetical protein